MGRRRPQYYYVMDKGMTWYMLLGFAFWYALAIGLCSFFTKRFIIDVIAAGEEFDGGVLLLIAMLLGPPAYFVYNFTQLGGAGRLLLHIRFDAEGIHCRGPFWKPFTIRWMDIRTYGMEYFSFSYLGYRFLFFSTEREYYVRDHKRMVQIKSTRITMAFRKELIAPISAYAPADIREKILEAAEKGQNCFHQRRAGKDI